MMFKINSTKVGHIKVDIQLGSTSVLKIKFIFFQGFVLVWYLSWERETIGKYADNNFNLISHIC